VRGVFALTLVIAVVLVILSLSSQYFSISILNRAFSDYRRAMYQSYLAHDVEYSLYRLMSSVRDLCAASGDPSECSTIASTSYASFVSAWAANGITISGGGLSVLALPDGVDVRLVTDLVWSVRDYSGRIPAGYGVG